MLTECQTESSTPIGEVIARRSDLSTFIVHLTRDENSETAKDRLKSIIESWTIEARTMYGAAVARFKELESQEGIVITSADKKSQEVVCFTETPLQYLYLITKKIDTRQFEFGPYGIAVTKSVARENGVNPVWYLDMTSGCGINHDWLTYPVERLIDSAIKSSVEFSKSDIAAIAPFIEQMGTGTRKCDGESYRKEFWWEREWRHKGNFKLPEHILVICPENEKKEFKMLVDTNSNGHVTAQYIDVTWGLEQVIARLAGFQDVYTTFN